MTEKFKALVSEMDHQSLEELRRSIAAEMNARRPAVEIGDIRPGMSAAEKEAVAREIARVLRGEDV
jgi:HAMP domain-containing protein